MWKVEQGTEIGTTAAAYADALNWKTVELGKKTMILTNTGEESLKYRLDGYAAENGLPLELVGETELAAGEASEFHYDRQWHRLIVRVKNGSNQTDWQIDYEGVGV